MENLFSVLKLILLLLFFPPASTQPSPGESVLNGLNVIITILAWVRSSSTHALRWCTASCKRCPPEASCWVPRTVGVEKFAIPCWQRGPVLNFTWIFFKAYANYWRKIPAAVAKKKKTLTGSIFCINNFPIHLSHKKSLNGNERDRIDFPSGHGNHSETKRNTDSSMIASMVHEYMKKTKLILQSSNELQNT